MNDSGVPILELPVPKFKRAVIGAVVLTAFVLFFVLLAIHNLCNWTAIIPSTIWLILVGAILVGYIKSDGYKKFTTDILGTFATKEFIRTTGPKNGASEFQYGFWMFGRRFLYFTVTVEQIESIKWNTGQASHMAGRDMNDWNVVVWYDHNDSVKSQKKHMLKKPDQDLYIIGMSGAKAEIASLGHAVLDLLRKAGATFEQGENDCTFVRQSIAVA